MWSIAGIVDEDTAFDLEDMYKAWDQDRADGYAATISLQDQTFVRNIQAPITATAVFTEAPSIEAHPASGLYFVSFGLTEV